MVDPQLDIEPYLEIAAEKGMKVTHIFETHVHADHRSGARPLAEVTGAPILMHASAGVAFPHVPLVDGEEHELGNVRITVLHTPGHTPDSIALVVTDHTRGPEPWFVLTGDTLLAGAVGRPDLLGSSAATVQAEQLYDSLHDRILALPDYLEVYPAHFGGAACGKGLSGKPHSTIGFERRYNPALQQSSKAAFVRFVLADLPPEPPAFADNRRRNLAGE